MRAKAYGSGWHKQSLRHSNARRLGRAGGTYSKGQKVYGRGSLSNPDTHYHLLYGTYKKTEKDGTIVLEDKGGRERRYDPKYLTPYRTTKQELIKGGLGDNKPDSQFDKKSLRAGMKVEREHTNNPLVAKEIAKDHLTEDPKYYKKLAKIEKK